MEYIIGVDGGGTKTEAIAYNLNGEELAKSITGFGNLVCGKEEALKNIILAIENCIEELGTNGLKAIYLGLAGAEAGENGSMVLKEVKERFTIHTEVMNDGELALKALLKGEEGILTISGTGSIAFGIHGEKKARSGGWGHLLGDEGSGYKIAIEALKRSIYESDCGIEKSNLTKEILKMLTIKEIEEIIGFVYSSTKKEIAAITPLIAKLGEEGDENAIAILKKEGIALAATTERVYNKLGFHGGCQIGLKGSVLLKAKILRKAFESYLKENLQGITIVDEDIPSAKGAYYMYLKELK